MAIDQFSTSDIRETALADIRVVVLYRGIEIIIYKQISGIPETLSIMIYPSTENAIGR